MDEQVKEKMQDNKYSISKTFVKDVKLVFENALAYNNKDDDVYKDALKLQKKFDKMWKEVEGHLEEWVAERQAKEEEKERRRESMLAGDTGEEGAGDGAGKKEGSASSGKKKVKIEDTPKKFVWEEKGGWDAACKEVLESLLAMEDSWPFEEPVDPKALQLADYTKIIKHPMDLGTVKSKLEVCVEICQCMSVCVRKSVRVYACVNACSNTCICRHAQGYLPPIVLIF